MAKINRNDLCPCGSGKKYKKCCYLTESKQKPSQPLVQQPDTKAPSVKALLDNGLKHHRAGQLAEAEAVYKKILKHQPNQPDALHLLGLIAHSVGKNEIAVPLIWQAIQHNPKRGLYHNNLGNVLKSIGNFAQALSYYATAIQLEPNNAGFFNCLANALQEQGDLQNAEQNFRRAIELAPDYPGYYFNLANLQQLQKNYPAAIANYQRAIALQPDYQEAYSNLGVAFKESGKVPEAIACYEKAIALNPNYPEAHSNLGVALKESGKLDAAIDCYQKSLALQPSAKTYNNLGVTLKDQGRLTEAWQSFQAALTLKPDDASTLNNLGTLLELQGKLDEAIACYRKALSINPYCHLTHNNLGNVLKDKLQLDAAIASYKTSLQIKPDYSVAHSNLYHLQLQCSDWTNYQADVERVKQAVLQGDSQYTPFSFLNICDEPALQQRCAQNYIAAKHPPAEKRLWTGQHYNHQKIRVAYVSGDLREHAVSYLMAGVFEKHDKERFDIFAISLTPDENSPMTQRLKKAFTQFINVSQKSDFEIATLIRQMEIDIAVDLMGFTKSSRTGIFSYRPAPIQVNYLGYPATMGADYIDYIIADQYLIPKEYQRYYTEKVVYLPDCFQANNDQSEINPYKPTRTEAGLPESGFIFCSFNNSYKINPLFFDGWMRLLDSVPNSILWQLSDDAATQQNLRKEAAKRGINPERLIFAKKLKHPEHLARFQLADLFLDTWPCNAGTTASDALWAGVPVITCAGKSMVSRMACSLLNAIGLPELITYNLTDYQQLAYQLATQPALLAQIRTKLAANRLTQPLFNTALFCQSLEQAYVTMWQNSPHR